MIATSITMSTHTQTNMFRPTKVESFDNQAPGTPTQLQHPYNSELTPIASNDNVAALDLDDMAAIVSPDKIFRPYHRSKSTIMPIGGVFKLPKGPFLRKRAQLV